MSSSTRFLRVLKKQGIGGDVVVQKLIEVAKPEKKRLACIVTGNKRSVIKKFNMGRHTFRDRGILGDIKGVKKATW